MLKHPMTNTLAKVGAAWSMNVAVATGKEEVLIMAGIDSHCEGWHDGNDCKSDNHPTPRGCCPILRNRTMCALHFNITLAHTSTRIETTAIPLPFLIARFLGRSYLFRIRIVSIRDQHQPQDSSSTYTSMDNLLCLLYDDWADLHAADASHQGPLFSSEESKELDSLLTVPVYPVYGERADFCATDASHPGTSCVSYGQLPVNSHVWRAHMPLHSEGASPPKPFFQANMYFGDPAGGSKGIALGSQRCCKEISAYRNISPWQSSSLPLFYFPLPFLESASPPLPSHIHSSSSKRVATDRQVAHIPTYIIGIGGSPSSGKSTLASHLSYVFKKFGPLSRVFIISQDAYLLPSADCPQITLQSGKRVVHRNCLFSVDWEDMIKDINNLKAGNYSSGPDRIRETEATGKGCNAGMPHMSTSDINRVVQSRKKALSNTIKLGFRSFWLARFCSETLTDNLGNSSTSLPSQLILIEGPLMNAVCPTALPPQKSGFGIFRSDTQQKA
ncbi:hypothetical protein CSAL01_07720 [Colletotrichum salicis]|uniref:Phosphoribulokinase/uridine kinase domain-containing protein n=1 Tax=Colletotrichum salicis TaxID=1209931 RepID=A0A135UIK4_9PEZI|nr:hypothetical protein CSAL01_07720 [Colletotrichum salicis]